MINQIQVWAPSTVQWSMCRHACMCSPRRPTLPNSGGHLRQCSGDRAARAQHAARSPIHRRGGAIPLQLPLSASIKCPRARSSTRRCSSRSSTGWCMHVLTTAHPPLLPLLQVQLSIHGDAWRLRDASGAPTDTVVTSRRHTLSKVRSPLIALVVIDCH